MAAPLGLFSRRATEPLGLPEWRHQMQKAGELAVDPERDQVVYHRMAPSGGWA